MGTSATTSVMPPIQQLQPSPKLMGRSSPDEPIPAPVKNMVMGPGEVGVNGTGNGVLGQNQPSAGGEEEL